MQTQTIDFHPPANAAAPILLPSTAGLFRERGERFQQLAAGHSLGDWLSFLGRLSTAQGQALATLDDLALPAAAKMEQAVAHGLPPLDINDRPPVWRRVLRTLCQDLRPAAPAGLQPALDALAAASDEALEQLADTLFNGDPATVDVARLPFVAAALQVVYTALASQLTAAELQVAEGPAVCPCCGSPAVASVVRLGSEINNLRYLHCSLCNSEWNLPRAVCTSCNSDQSLSLHEIDGRPAPVRAETCGHCQSYLKIVYQEKDPQVDPVADDLATLALDLLVDAAGYQRAGPNLFLFGSAA